jgi:hypothetical protein
LQLVKQDAVGTAYKLAAKSKFRTDPMGDPYWRKLLGIAAVVGGAEMAANAYDTSILEFAVAHVPFLTHRRTGEWEFQMPLAIDTVLQAQKFGLSNIAKDPYLFGAVLLDHMGLYTVKRLEAMLGARELIPDIYKSPTGKIPDHIRYFAGLPSTQAMETQQKRTLRFEERKRRRHIDRLEKKNQHYEILMEAFKNFAGYAAKLFSVK